MPKFLEYIKNIFKGKDTKKLETASVKFKDEELQKYFERKFKKEEINIEDLASLKYVSYSGKGEKVLQEDIDKISKYCDISNGQLFLDNLDITGISFENLKVNELVIKRSKVGDTKYPSKDVLKSLGVDNSVGINFDDFNGYSLEKLYLSAMDVVDFEIAKKFKDTLIRLSIFDNPLNKLDGIEEFPKLKELSLSYTDIDIDSKEEIAQLREKGIEVEFLGTPLEEEIKRLYKIKKEEEEKSRLENEGQIEVDEEFLKHLNHSGIFGQVEENRKITVKDIERLNNRSKVDDIDLSIPSEYAAEFLKINGISKIDLRKLSIDIGKGDCNFNIQKFLEEKNNSSLIELDIETPSSINNQPQDYLASRYGITYNLENDQYRYDDIKKFNEELNKMTINFKNQEKEIDTVKEIYKYIRDNVSWKEQKLLDVQAVKTLSGQQIASVEIKENMTPYRKLEYILKNHSTDNFGMRNLMYHMLLNLGYEANIEMKDVEFGMPNQVKKSSNIDIEVNDKKYSLDLDNKEGMIVIDCETREHEIINPNPKQNEIEIEDIER